MAFFEGLNEPIVYFSKLLGTSLSTEDGGYLGRLTDIFVDFSEVYPQAIAIQYKYKNQFFYIEWDDIKRLNYKKILIKENVRIRKSRTFPKVTNKKILTSLLANQYEKQVVDYPPVGRVVLDRQIVDTSGKKVVRVNDIHFIKISRYLRVTHAAVGLRSMVRRLGYERFIDGAVRLINKRSHYLQRDVLIDWKCVHAIPDKSIQDDVQLNVSNEDLSNIHPADLADILEELDAHGREHLFDNLNPEMAAEVLSEVDSDIQASFVEDDTPEEVAEIIENMGTDEAADLLSELSSKKAQAIIDKIEDEETKAEIKELLRYEEDTGGGLMTTDLLQVQASTTIADIIHEYKTNYEDYDAVYDIYVVNDDEVLLGVLPLKKLFMLPQELSAVDAMEGQDIKSIHPGADWEDIAEIMSKYNLVNLPVVDEERKLLGMVSVDDVLPWLLDEK